MDIRTLTGEVVTALKALGHDARLGNPNAMDAKELAHIETPDFKIAARVVTYGAKKGRIDWRGFVSALEGVSYYDRPLLGSTQSAGDAPAQRIAKALISKIIEPAKEPVAKYQALYARYLANRDALPVAAANLRAQGATVHEPRVADIVTRATFYFDHDGARLSGDLSPEGNISINSGTLTAQQMEAVISALKAL